MIFRRAEEKDIPLLIRSRLNLLRSANGLSMETDLSNVTQQLKTYYSQGLEENRPVAILAFDDSIFVGTGGICYYRVLPTYHNPTGWKAYIINMYTEDAYRGKGVATKILDLLVTDSLARGIKFITLEATKLGRPIYERYGFVDMPSEMQLKNETYG